MKRIVTLLLAAGLVMGAYTGAQAADVKVSGKWNFGFHAMSNANLEEGEDDFNASQRLRLQIDIIASENLKGVVFFEIGNSTWGVADKGADFGADDKVVEVKRSYIDWTAPNTDLKIRMGVQGIALPGGAFGSPVLDDDMAGITMSYAFSDEFALTAVWARLYDGGSSYDGTDNGNDEWDLFALIAPIALDGHAITPYFVYSSIGEAYGAKSNTVYEGSAYASNGTSIGSGYVVLDDGSDSTYGDDVDVYYFGVAYSMTAFDPFTLDVSFVYGDADGGIVDQSGWMIDFKAAYALDFMTPALLGWYASGSDSGEKDGVLPTFGGGAWAPTSFGYVGSCYEVDTWISESPEGTWGIGLEFADISFIEDLTHVFRVVYSEGTSDKNATSHYLSSYDEGNLGIFMTEEDSSWEINLDSTYKIYENLAFILELGMIDYDMEDGDYDKTAYKAGFNFVYGF